MDIFGKIIDIIIAVMVMIAFPLIWASQKQDTLYMRAATDAVDAMCEEISNKGYLDADMYGRLTAELSRKGGMYDIRMEHAQVQFTVKDGSTEIYDDISYTSDILEALGSDTVMNTYYFEKGDRLTVSVQKRPRSIGQRLTNMIFKTTNSHYYITTVSIMGQSDEYRNRIQSIETR